MSTNIKLKRSSVSGKRPTTSDLSLGELGLNTFDGKLFVKTDRSGTENIVTIGSEEPGYTYFVSKNGIDTNDGKSINSAFATVTKALTVATSGDTVRICPGVYTEVFPLEIPVGVSINGDGIRSTLIQPTSGTKDNDCFLLNGETAVSDLTLGNFFYNSTNDTGYGFRFKSGMSTTTRSPYIQRITILNKGSSTSSSDPYGFDTVDNPPVSYKAGRGAKIDGSVVNINTLEPSILFNECTFICPNNTGLVMTNGARTEWLNCFTYFCDKSIDAFDEASGLAGVGKTRIKLSGVTVTTTTPSSTDIIYYLETNSKSGTYSRTGTTVTITYNSHKLTNGDVIYADFTSGTATDGYYAVSNVATNTFDITDTASGTTSGNVLFKNALGYGTISSYNAGTLKLTNKGTGLFDTASSRSGKIVTAYGDAKLSTAQFKFGTSSLLLDGTGDYLQTTSSSDFVFSDDFTVETWIYPTSLTGNHTIFTLGIETAGRYTCLVNSSGQLVGNFYGGSNTTFGGSIGINSWTHVALVRSGSIITAYVNGTALGTTETNSLTINNTGQFRIGVNSSAVSGFIGYIDELRISNNSRYTGNFTAPTFAFSSDVNTKLLLHLDGDSGTIVITDSTLVIQDVRILSSTGTLKATATTIILADYQEFGASMRSIASAAVFGNYGIIGNGPGVVIRLFAFNFGHIGAAKDFSQDESLVIQGNEVIEFNHASIQYVSIDQSGDFRVGDAFYVNEKKGIVTFGGQSFNISSLSNLDVTDGTNTTAITPTTIRVGTLEFGSNTISTTSGNLIIDPSGSGSTTINGNVSINGTLTATTALLSGIIQGDTQVAITDTGSNGTISLVADGTTIQSVTSTGASITVNSSSDALRITQIGTGNALVVEDSTNPDSTPFVVTATGAVVIGNNQPLVTYDGFNSWFSVLTPTENNSALVFRGNNGSTTSGTAQTLRLLVGGSGSSGSGTVLAHDSNDGTGTQVRRNNIRFYDTGISFEQSNNTDVLTVDTINANVGIAITSPTEKLDVNGKIKTNDSVIISDSQITSTTTTITSSTAQFVADSFSITTYRTTKYLIQVLQTGSSKFYSSEVLLMHDGTNVYVTQYGTLATDNSPVSYIDADINSENVRLLITPSVANTTTKISRISLTA